MTEKDKNLLYGVMPLILPENILDQFDIVRLEDEDIDRHDGTYQPFKHLAITLVGMWIMKSWAFKNRMVCLSKY